MYTDIETEFQHKTSRLLIGGIDFTNATCLLFKGEGMFLKVT